MADSRSPFLRFLLPLALAVMGAVLCGLLIPAEVLAVKRQLVDFPDSDVPAHQARPFVIAALCFLPSLAGLIYSLGCTLDRYIAREFARIFGICLAALLVVWLLLDLTDNITEFRESSDLLKTLATFYGTRSPAILLLLLPYSLLLSLLYSLGKLSGNREIIAMIQSGRGVLRITLPLIIAGVFFSLLNLGLNYQWAPIAEGTVNEILDVAKGDEGTKAKKVLYRDPNTRRLWMIGAFPPNYQVGEPLMNVEVTTTRDDESLESRLSAKKAFWDRKTHEWTFEEPVLAKYQAGQPAKFEPLQGPLKIASWSETPWQLIKPGLSAANLGIPDLNTWLRTNTSIARFADPSPYLTQWHYRWALPFTCLVSVLLATPLAVHFSRRGSGGGIFLAVALSALMLLFSNISLALGEAGTLHPFTAAWLPNITFTMLGLYLFHRRNSGRQIYFYLRRFLPGNE
jgi:lipopolysaccharide export system permease protein